MANLQIKSETIATFGGIFHVMDVFDRLGLGELIDSSSICQNNLWFAPYRHAKTTDCGI